MKKTFKDAFRFFGSVAFISALAVGASVLPFSCKLSDDGVEVETTNGDSVPPTLVSFSVLSAKSVKIDFSEEISLSKVSIKDSDGKSCSISDSSVVMSKDKTSAEILLDNETETGKSYVLTAVVSDAAGNSLELSQDFFGYNDKVARLILSEVRSKPTANKSDVLKSRVEFVEFYVLNGGNLSGLEVDFGYYSKSYKFPSINVKTGEYIVLHLCKYGTKSSGFIDETGSNLELSTAYECSSSRDLWFDNVERVIVVQNDVVALIDNNTGLAVDGLMYSDTKKETWTREHQSELASLLASSSVWSGSSPESGVSSENTTTARTFSRINIPELAAAYNPDDDAVITASASDWIVATSATPGEANLTEAYTK